MIRTVFARRSLYWLMVLLTGGAIVISGLPSIFKALIAPSDTIGTVNGLPIYLYEYHAELSKEKRLLAAYREQFGQHYKKVLSYIGKSEDIEQTSQEQLITNKLLFSMALSIPIRLHANYITRELAQAKTIYGILGEALPGHYLFEKNGILRLDMLKKFLKSQGLTVEQFEKLAESFLVSHWGLKLAYGATIESKSSRQLYNREHFHKRTFSVEVIDIGDFIREASDKPITDKEIADYYESHSMSSSYWSPERRSGKLWVFDLNLFVDEGVSADNPKTEGMDERRKRFLEAGQQLALLGDSKAFSQFIETYHGKASSLVKVDQNQGETSSLREAIKALFSVGRAGESAVSADETKGYVVELSEIQSPHKLPFDSIRDIVVNDMHISMAKEKAFALLSSANQGEKKHIIQSKVTLLPGESAVPDVFKRYKIPLAAIKGLLFEGASREGLHEHYVYRIVLLSSTEEHKISKDISEKPDETKHLYEEAGELMLHNLIASLRSHAIILIRTESDNIV